MNDENAPGGTPIMQPSLPGKDFFSKLRGVKDDRGNRRDRDGGERFDRSDKPGEHISGEQGIPIVPGAGILGHFIPAPPQQGDPRRLRSYKDLDAPEDEVAVIDYRSL
ncbi:hypothetical protein HAX54_025687 [Datura stramonium]|uniref:Uncharacterized protein n=1 Tax=Datura stramonium TaxID=4076 RepID=A0ABS8V035_DATST|nr:hypothetical protein [Datura stramonium]